MIRWFSTLPVTLWATTSRSRQLFFISWRCIAGKWEWCCNNQRYLVITAHHGHFCISCLHITYCCGMERPLHTIPQISLPYKDFCLCPWRQQQALPPPRSLPLHVAVWRVFPSHHLQGNRNQFQHPGPRVKQYCPLQELVRQWSEIALGERQRPSRPWTRSCYLDLNNHTWVCQRKKIHLEEFPLSRRETVLSYREQDCKFILVND